MIGEPFIVSCVGPGLFPHELPCKIVPNHHYVSDIASNIPINWRCKTCFELHRVELRKEHDIRVDNI